MLGARTFDVTGDRLRAPAGANTPDTISHRRTPRMTPDDVRRRAFAMPLTSPAYPVGPYRFVNREFLIITYRTDPEALRRVVPGPLEFDEPLVKYEFIRMPDSTGFGDYTESGQVIPVRLGDQRGRLRARHVPG